MPVPPPDERGIRYRFPVPLPLEKNRFSSDALYKCILLWLQANLLREPDKFLPSTVTPNRSCVIQRSEWQHAISLEDRSVDFIDLYIICREALWSPTDAGASWPIQSSTNVLALLIVPETVPVRDVVRRIRRMQASEKCRYIIVSPDESARKALELQGIDFLHYPLVNSGSAA